MTRAILVGYRFRTEELMSVQVRTGKGVRQENTRPASSLARPKKAGRGWIGWWPPRAALRSGFGGCNQNRPRSPPPSVRQRQGGSRAAGDGRARRGRGVSGLRAGKQLLPADNLTQPQQLPDE